MSKISSMIKRASDAIECSYAPYSNYPVACCVSSTDKQLFTGVNVENCAYGLTMCAEASAIAQMVASGARQIGCMVILTRDGTLCPPCGACRQIMLEFATPETRIHLCSQSDILKTMTMKDLLPTPFYQKPVP